MIRRMLCGLLLIWCAQAATADDREGDLIRFINENRPSYFELVLASLRFRDFPAENSGRLSVIGEFRLTEPFVEVVSGLSNLTQQVRSRGFNTREISKALDDMNFLRPGGSGGVSELQIAQQSGTTYPFSAELPYLETVSGIRLSGQIETTSPRGRPLSSIAGTYYFVDSPEFDTFTELVIGRIENRRVEDERQRLEAARLAEEQRLAREAAAREANKVQTSPCTGQFYVRAKQEGRIANCLEVTLQQGGDRHFQPGGNQFPCIRFTRPDAVSYERIDSDGNGKAEGFELYSTSGRVTITAYSIAKGATFRRETCD